MTAAPREAVLALMQRHGIGFFEYDGPDGALSLHLDPDTADYPPAMASAPGVFLWRHPLEKADPEWPRHVRSGETIGWLKIGPLLRPVTAPADGIIDRPRLPHGSLAGYGERLF